MFRCDTQHRIEQLARRLAPEAILLGSVKERIKLVASVDAAEYSDRLHAKDSGSL